MTISFARRRLDDWLSILVITIAITVVILQVLMIWDRRHSSSLRQHIEVALRLGAAIMLIVSLLLRLGLILLLSLLPLLATLFLIFLLLKRVLALRFRCLPLRRQSLMRLVSTPEHIV